MNQQQNKAQNQGQQQQQIDPIAAFNQCHVDIMDRIAAMKNILVQIMRTQVAQNDAQVQEGPFKEFESHKNK